MTVPAGFWKAFGPGLIWAAAAIGVSHLVQSTRAGALSGFGAAGVILLALILKYPFFEYGPRYAAATGRTLVEGYRRIGPWALWLYFVMTLATAVIHQLAVLLLLAFLIQFALGAVAPVWVIGGLAYVACSLLLLAGRFRGLDLTIKVVVTALAVSTLVAAAIATPRADFSTLSLSPLAATALPLGFVLALVGFMPAPVEMSVWSSLWTLAKDRAVGQRTSVETATLDFKIGYVGTAVLAFAFLMLGAVVMHGSGETFSEAGPTFSTQLVELYTSTLGEWTRVVVMVAVLTTIFSTALVVIDAFPRTIDRCLPNIRGGGGTGPRPCHRPGILGGPRRVRFAERARFELVHPEPDADDRFRDHLRVRHRPHSGIPEPARGDLRRRSGGGTARAGHADLVLFGTPPAGRDDGGVFGGEGFLRALSSH